jgi:hypothetical protein
VKTFAVLCGPSIFVALAIAACGDSSIAACGDEPDVSGGWTLAFAPTEADLGVGATLPGTLTVDAELEQAGKTDVFGIGHYVYGTLGSSDPNALPTLTIPRLIANDGTKTGAILGCTLRINVPIAMPVSDDNVNQGPLQLSLAGQITMKGIMTGVDVSTLILANDPDKKPRDFSWTGTRH